MDGKKIGFYGGKMLPLHIGHIFSILHSASRCDELHVFLFVNTLNEDELISKSKFPKDLLQPDIRELILKYEFGKYENIKLHKIDCKKHFKVDDKNKWDYNSTAVIDSAGCLPNIIFSNEIEQKEHFKILYPFANFELINENRSLIDINSSKIREEGAFKNWEFLTKGYRSLCAKSIVILGNKIYRNRLISDLSKLFDTSLIDDINCDEVEIKKKILEARFNSNKIFFINSLDENNEKYIPFYNLHNYRFSINFTDEEIKKYQSINLNGEYDKILNQGILRIKSILTS